MNFYAFLGSVRWRTAGADVLVGLSLLRIVQVACYSVIKYAGHVGHTDDQIVVEWDKLASLGDSKRGFIILEFR